MGYRSHVAMYMVFKSEDDRKRFWELAPKPAGDEGRALLLDNFTFEGRAIHFEHTHIKWYSSNLVGKGYGYEEIDALLGVFEFARIAYDIHGIDCAGGFARVGEEMGDVEECHWRFEDEDHDLDPYIALSVMTSLDFDPSILNLPPIGSDHG